MNSTNSMIETRHLKNVVIFVQMIFLNISCWIMERNSSGNLECIDQFLKNLKVRSPHVNKSST